MENWMWVSLYVIQTLVGAIFYRKYFNVKGNVGESIEDCIIMSAVVIVNCISLVFLIFYGITSFYKK